MLLIGVGGAHSGGFGVQYFIGELGGKRFVNGNLADKVHWVDYYADLDAAPDLGGVPDSDGHRINAGLDE